MSSFTSSHSIRNKKKNIAQIIEIRVPFVLRREPSQISIIITSDPNHSPITFVILFHFKVDQAPSRSVNAQNFKRAPIRVNKCTLSVLFFSLVGGKEKKKRMSSDAPSISLKEQR